MSRTVIIQLHQAIKSVSLVNAPGDLGPAPLEDPHAAGLRLAEAGAAVIDGLQGQLEQSCELLNNLAGQLEQLHSEMIRSHREQITRLAVEIARKILVQKIKDGDYAIEAIVQEALANSPTPQGIIVHLHPDDLSTCQQVQQAHPDGPFAHIELVANHSVGRAECMLETPKGMIKALIDEKLKTIAQALEKAQ